MSKLIYLDNAATSLKTPLFIQKLIESYNSDEWFETREQKKESLLMQLFEFLSVEVENITLVPSSSYAINEIWNFLIDNSESEHVNVYLTREEHISNLSSIVYLQNTIKDKKIKINYFDYSELENIEFETDDLLLLTALDNLGINCISYEQVRDLREKHPKITIIGDFTQYLPHLNVSSEICDLFDFIYFSAHKFFGPFGIGVVVSKSKEFARMINEREKYWLDWRSIVVWEETLKEVISIQTERQQKEELLKSYWIDNIPSLPGFSYYCSKHSPIFLLGLKSSYLHDFIFLLENRNIVFRAYDFCSFNIDISEKQMRFSLSFLNEYSDIEKLFQAMKYFSSLKF